jgi:hypothetical protein
MLIDAQGDDFTLYCLVRTDLPVHTQVVQAVHAAAEAGRTHYASAHGVCRAVVLRVSDQASLNAWQAKLDVAGIAHEAFVEPDDDLGLTALCTRPVLEAERRLFRKLPLWSMPGATPAVAWRRQASGEPGSGTRPGGG